MTITTKTTVAVAIDNGVLDLGTLRTFLETGPVANADGSATVSVSANEISFELEA